MTTVTDAAARTAPHGVRRWGGYVVLVIVFSIACGFLSWWQWSRNAETMTETKLVAVNWTQPAVPLDELVPRLTSWRHGIEWRRVTLHGRYLADEQLLVRNRARNDNPGFEVLVPLRLDDGRVFVVDRGWLPIGTDQDSPDTVPAPPAGEVEVTARLQQSEPDLPGRSAPRGQVPDIHLPSVATLVGDTTYTGAYGLMTSEQPSVADRPVAADRPVVDPGPFLSYAIQWIMFAVLAFIGLIWAYRREKRLSAMTGAERDDFRAERRRSRDSDVEDAILDAEER